MTGGELAGADAPAEGPVLLIRPMAVADLGAIQRIEKASFTTPWPPHAYRQELETNRLARYLVAVLGGEVVAYGGVWFMVDEAHITTFAVHPAYRRQRIGERLLLAFLDLSIERRAREATLEVRLSNLPARRLYEKYGFRPVGIRPRYYSDDQEDALIMTTEPLSAPAMRERIGRLRAALDAAPAPSAVPDGEDAAEESGPQPAPAAPANPATTAAAQPTATPDRVVADGGAA
jgi:ribosomal-protein-alanine N-acetyltransferase